MKSKTKSLKKGNYTPGNATPAPAKKAETKTTTTVASNSHNKRNLKKEIEARSRARRMRSMLKLGMKEELIEEMFAQEDNRMILVLLDGKYTVQDGTKTKTVRKRDEHHKLVSKETIEVPNILQGFAAARKYVEEQNLQFMSGCGNAIWVLSDKDNVDDAVEKLKILGRVSVTKPEKHTYETEAARIKKEKKSVKKPSNNTAEAKTAAKTRRKNANLSKAAMRPYYAALRKGGVSARIKKFNPDLAEKIENWIKKIKKQKAAETEKAERIAEHRRVHRQMSSLEMKANKRARKAAKHLTTQERRKAAEAKRAAINAKAKAERAKKAQKPIQTKLDMAA